MSKQRLNQVIDIDERHSCGGVAHHNREVVRDVVAPCRNRRVVVRTTPLAENIGKAIDVDGRPGLLAIREDRVLSRLLRLSVIIIKRRLGR